jgi:hypothetical protein
MPETQKIHPDSDYANSTVPTGTLLVFLGYDTGAAGGNVVQRCKDSSGNFGTLSGNLTGRVEALETALDGLQTTLEGI